jgi:protein tyrosine phosphatase
MIWQENVQTIAVVTNLEEKGKVKCSCYWPPLGKIGLYGAIVVSFEEELILSECTMRKFKLAHSYERDEKFRTVTQFHFTGWPDYGVPSYATSLLNFVKRVRSHHEHLMTQSPMVIHCRYIDLYLIIMC